MVDKKVAIVLLAVILLIGLYVRVYHIDYPVIGYHNTKETHTLGEGLQLYKGGDAFVNYEMYSIRESNPNGVHMDNFPLLSWINAGLWSITGPEVWIARLVIILFSLGAIIMTYLVVEKFFNKKGIAIIAAFLMSIMPLLVFFGRQVQYDMPALFFALTGIYFFLRWNENPTHKYFVLASGSLVFAALLKLPFLILAVPVVAIFPFKKFFAKSEFKEKYWKQFVIAIVFFLAIVAFVQYSGYLDSVVGNPASIESFDPEKFSTVLTPEFWQAISNYALLENFTLFWLVFAFAGLGIAVKNIIKRKSNSFEKFIVIYGLTFFVYILFSPPQMMGHNYYQMPYAPLVALSMAYFFFKIFNLTKRLKIKAGETEISYIPHIVIGILVLISILSIGNAATRQFDTQFYGLDIAGEYVKSNSNPGEVIFESGGQDRGIAWHSERRLIDFTGPDDRPGQLMRMEDNMNLTWIFVYQWGFNDILGKEDVKNYIYNNYELSQIAFIQQGDQNTPIYLLFRKGGSFNESRINSLIAGKPVQFREYELTQGKVRVNYVNV